MGFLKKLLMALLAIVLLAVVVSFFLPSKTTMERSTVINAPAAQVFDQINTLTNWKNWSPWYAMEPSAKLEYSDKVSGKNAYYTWAGDEIGAGKLTIMESTPKLIKTAMDFDGQGSATSDWILKESDKGTDVTWTFESDNGMNPMSRIMGLFIGNFLGPSYEDGLANLKKVCESMPAKPQFSEVEEVEVNGIKYLAVRDVVKTADIQNFYTDNFQKILSVIASKKLEVAGQPRGLFYSWEPEKNQTDMAAAIPISSIALEGEPKEKIALAGSDMAVYENLVVLDHYGPYEQTELAHNAIGKWIEEKGKAYNWPVVEEYVTDPGTEPDAKKWLTKIYYTY